VNPPHLPSSLSASAVACVVLPALAFAQDTTSVPAAALQNYAPVFERCHAGSGQRLAIRAYRQGGVEYRLTVDPQTLGTRLEPASTLRCDSNPASAEALLEGTPYRRALDVERSTEGLMQDAGLVHSMVPVTGYFLTADLCPSSKPGFNQALFETLERASQVHHSGPLPVSLSVSGGWIRRHADSFLWLRKEAEAGRLQITWTNHSFTHPYDSHGDIAHNFMRAAGVDPLAEVLELEKMLVAEGIAPSVFFRFPGLVSSPELIEVLERLHLVAVGSDAWLAKGELPKPGSVILIHGNQNEPQGVKMMLEWVARQAPGSINFLPLPSIAGSPR
jgi:hypothetical protein